VPEVARVDGAILDGSTVRITTHEPARTAAGIITRLDGAPLVAIEVVRPSLESVFLAVTGRRYTATDETGDTIESDETAA